MANLVWYDYNIMNKEKILLFTIIVALVVSISFTFYKTIILKDFTVVNISGELEEAPS